MKYWVGVLCIALLLLMILTSQLVQEQFVSATAQSTFVEQQQKDHTVLSDTPILINPGTNLNGINQALGTSDITQSRSRDVDYTQYFEEDPLIKLRSKDEQTCRNARHPRNLSRPAGSKQGCGWWFVPDGPGGALGVSIGTLGTVTGPIDRLVVRSNPTGTWYWNLEDAARMEDIKLCKRITLCEAVTPDCGWCETRGYAVPIKDDGTVAYVTDDAGSCDSAVYRGGSCPVPVAPPATPILDNNGNIVGEKTPPPPTNICSPRNGKLTRECLIALAVARGCGTGGSLYRMIMKASPPTEADRVAMDILGKANVVTLTPGALGNGDISISSALSVYQALGNAVITGSSKLIRQAATYLAIGGGEVDLCDVGEDSIGPFSPDCLGRAFREVGCQASGAGYPYNASGVQGYTWGSIKRSYRDLATSMNSSDAFVQADAIKNCLGTNINVLTKI